VLKSSYDYTTNNMK